MTTRDELIELLRRFLLESVLAGEHPSKLTESTPLVSQAILDSLSTLKLVALLEQTYRIEIAPHEMDSQNFETIADIARLVESKLARRGG